MYSDKCGLLGKKKNNHFAEGLKESIKGSMLIETYRKGASDDISKKPLLREQLVK